MTKVRMMKDLEIPRFFASLRMTIRVPLNGVKCLCRGRVEILRCAQNDRILVGWAYSPTSLSQSVGEYAHPTKFRMTSKKPSPCPLPEYRARVLKRLLSLHQRLPVPRNARCGPGLFPFCGRARRSSGPRVGLRGGPWRWACRFLRRCRRFRPGFSPGRC
jgi:hypothetical protein